MATRPKLPWTYFLVSAMALITSARAASFDCAKAYSQVERLVCSDDNLSALDETMATAYKVAKSNSAAFVKSGAVLAGVTRDQRTWLVRRNECKDRMCVSEAYNTRLREFLVGA